MTTSADILSAAMGLQPAERAEVVRRRLKAIRSGEVELSDWDDVLADARKTIASL